MEAVRFRPSMQSKQETNKKGFEFMSVTYGFYNSLNHDRVYDATQMSRIFDGIIEDGVYQSIGDCFAVTAATGDVINVGSGRAWFNHTWTLNDATLPITADASEVLLNRYDAVVLEVNEMDSVRENCIKIIKGTPSSNPVRPEMTNDESVHQYPLAYIYRAAGSSEIKQADITNMVGTSSCPFVIGVLSVMTIDMIVSQWQDQWDEWFTSETSEGNNQMSQWMQQKQLEFNTWFGNLQTILDGDVASKLAIQVSKLQEKFETLGKEHCIYQDVEDSSDEPIEDSYETTLEGRIAYQLA